MTQGIKVGIRLAGLMMGLVGMGWGQRSESPKWNFSPVHWLEESKTGVQKEKFEGLVFGFFKPPEDRAEIEAWGKVNGDPVHLHRIIDIKMQVDEEGKETGFGTGMMPFEIGNPEKFELTWIKVKIGEWKSEVDREWRIVNWQSPTGMMGKGSPLEYSMACAWANEMEKKWNGKGKGWKFWLEEGLVPGVDFELSPGRNEK